MRCMGCGYVCIHYVGLCLVGTFLIMCMFKLNIFSTCVENHLYKQPLPFFYVILTHILDQFVLPVTPAAQSRVAVFSG